MDSGIGWFLSDVECVRAMTFLGIAAITACLALPSLAGAAPTLLVKVDPSASGGERAQIAEAIDATSSRPLPAGWRAYRLDAALTPGQARRKLAGLPVAALEADQVVQLQSIPNDPSFASQPNLLQIKAPAAWDRPAGAPVTVAVLDTGLSAHADIDDRLWTNPGEIAGDGIDNDHNGYVDDVHGWDFFSGGGPLDGNGNSRHGTHVAGIIAAQRDNATGIAGIADNARIMTVRMSGDSGGTLGAGLAGLQYALANGAKVINMSWTSTVSTALCDAVADAGAQGVVLVAAAGNREGSSGPATDIDQSPLYPAGCDSPALISVAATDATNELAAFSNYGASRVDVGAPGASILSLAPGGTLAFMNGTSMAAPHVAAAATILVGVHPELRPVEVAATLRSSGIVRSSLAGTTVSGRSLDLDAALGRADAPPDDSTAPSAFSPVAPGHMAAVGARPTLRWSEARDDQGTTGYRVLLDGSEMAVVSGESLKAIPPADLGEGTHSWQVIARDAAGNTRASAVSSFLVDDQPPDPAVITSPSRTTDPLPIISWEPISDAGSGIATLRLEGPASYGKALSPLATSTASPVPLWDDRAQVVFTLVATDNVGNERRTDFSIIHFTSASPYPIAPIKEQEVGVRPMLSWQPPEDGLSPLARLEVILDGALEGTVGPTETSYALSRDLPPGTFHEWYVRAIDDQGRIGNRGIADLSVFRVAGTLAPPTPPPALVPGGTNPPYSPPVPRPKITPPAPRPAPVTKPVTRRLRVAPAPAARTYVISARVGGRWVMVSRGRLAPRAAGVSVRVAAKLKGARLRVVLTRAASKR